MPVFNLNIPTNVTADLVAAADEMLLGRGIAIAGMTATERGQRFLVEVLRDTLVARRREAAVVAGQAAVDAAVAQAMVDASGIN